MPIIVILFGIILILGLLVLLGKYIYYYFYPNDTVEKVIANSSLVEEISLAGQSGKNGQDGVLGDLAVNGLNGKAGEKGEMGNSGKKSLVVGARGVSGNNGIDGPQGDGGSSGIKGSPSNSLVPFVCYSQDNNDNLAPIVLEHNFSYNDEIHKLTASFIFDDVTCFSFKNGPTNTRFRIDTSGPQYHDIPVSSPTGRARRIYANIRVILERRTEGITSDGTIFYSSSPINRSGYLISSDVDLTNDSKGVERLEEIIIDLNREFGLDFSTINSSTLSYNYLLSGLARYRVVFNIDPPLVGVKARLEERFSPNPLSYFAIPAVFTESKSNLIKLKSGEDIYMLSPPFAMGKVVIKDSSNPNSIWTMQNYQNLSDSISGANPQLIDAFDFLENDINTFRDNLNRAKTALISKKFFCDGMPQNLLVRLKSSDPKPPPDPNFVITAPDGYKLFSTKAEVNDFYVIYPNTTSPLIYPSDLKSSTFYLSFVITINIKHFENMRYVVYLEDGNPNNFSEITNTNSFVVSTLKIAYGNGITIIDSDHIYHVINILNQNLDFSNFMGRRIILKFSVMSMNFESHVGGFADYNKSVTDRFTDHPSSENNFETGSSNYDFLNSGNHIWGFDMKFSASKFDVFNDVFQVGYRSATGGIYFQKVVGFKQTNGDYILDVPSNGY